jgi:protein-disulfide isomerase
MALAAAMSIAAQAEVPKERPPLSSVMRAAIDSLRRGYIVEQCKKPLAQCPASCLIAAHLDTFLTWVAGIESTTVDIGLQLDKRYKVLTADSITAIDTAGYPVLGDPRAPVSVVLYVSSLCSLCKHMMSALIAAHDTGALTTRVCIIAKPFGAAPGDRAFMAAWRLGKAWELENALSLVKQRTDQPVVMHIADSLRIDTTRLKTLMGDPAVERAIARSRTEGARNGVRVTPAIFINRHPYHSFKDPQWVIDAISYAVSLHQFRARQ